MRALPEEIFHRKNLEWNICVGRWTRRQHRQIDKSHSTKRIVRRMDCTVDDARCETTAIVFVVHKYEAGMRSTISIPHKVL